MDFESDEELSVRSNYGVSLSNLKLATGGRDYRSDLSDMDIDPSSPGKDQATARSSTSFDHVSSTLGDVLSLKNASDVSDGEAHPDDEKPDLLFASDSCQRSQRIPSLGHDFSKAWEPAATTVLGAVAFTKGKTGYGIPEGEMDFAHFPESVVGKVKRRRGPANTKIERNSKDSSAINSHKNADNPSGLHFKSSESAEDKTNRKPKQSSLVSKLILLSFIAAVLYCIAVIYTVFKEQKCKLSREFSKQVLEMDLDSNVFGQHLAARIIPDKIEGYFSKFHISSSEPQSAELLPEISPLCKPLVLSFDGWTGVGKNYVSKFIIEAFRHSKVMNYIIPLNFPHKAFEDVYHLQIQQWILGNFTQCRVNFIVIDEMDKAFPGVTEGLAEAINALTQPCSTAVPVIFLLLSNTNANDINRAFLKFMLESATNKREQLSQDHFNSIFVSELNAWSSVLVKNHLIDAFVPFLPLEREHVIQCIRRDLVSKRFSTDLGTVNKILRELSFSSFGDIHLSQTGCKRVADKVDLVMFEKH